MPAFKTTSIAIITVALLTSAQPVRAGLSADARCRKALASGVRRVTAAALKGAERCHRDRMRGEIAPGVDCNDPSQLTGSALDRVDRASAKLDALAARSCGDAGTPSALGFDPCPAPCGAISIATYADVAECLDCVARDRSHDVAAGILGTPAPSADPDDETVCHRALGGAVRRFADERLKAQRLCRTDEDKGTPTGFDCRDGDYEGRLADAVARMHARLAGDGSCPPASVVALDLCASPDALHRKDPTPPVAALHACVEERINGAAGDLYDRVYAPASPPPPDAPFAASLASAWDDSGGQGFDQRNPRFRLTLASAATVSITLASGAADAYLYLLDADGGTVLAEDDNGAGGSDSRITTALAAGRYLLVAATASAGAVGDFTIATDAGALQGCLFAYGQPSHAGFSRLFCDAGTGEEFSDETYSSLRVPKGLFVRAYENADGTGRARTYFADAASLAPHFDNVISRIEWGAFDGADFFMAMVSDSQITWGHCSDNPGSALCAAEQSFFGAATEQAVAAFYNTNLVDALNTIAASIGPHAFGGVIVNGDLTEFGKQDTDLEDYIQFYDRGVAANVYPGLGNHDYANNVDDCFANFCASAMVHYLDEQVRSLNVPRFDFDVIETPLPGSPPVRFDYIGSLGYSWDIGGVHFVQLNNYPTYTRLWHRALPNSDNWYDIQSSILWLRDDLQIALDGGKELVVNFHDWGSADVAAFRDALDDFPVSAAFGGHYHGSYGLYAESGPYTDGNPVPVFLSGSAHYGTILVTRFTGGKLYVWVLRVDQLNGGALQVRQGGIFADVGDLSTLFDVCPGCTTTYEYAYDFR